MKRVAIGNYSRRLKVGFALRAGSMEFWRISGLACLASAALLVWTAPAMAQAGQLDPTFGTAGLFITQDTQSFDARADAVAVQSDGRIVVGGEISSLAGVLRLNTNGTLDSSFGSGGMVTINVPSGLGGGVQVVGVAIQSDGKIVAGISTINSDGEQSFLLARLTAAGSLDSTLGSGGIVETLPFGLQLSPTVLALQPDGRILLAGDGVMARYNTGGQLDQSFGSAGLALLINGRLTAIALQPNGQILVASGGPARDAFPPSFDTLSVAGLISRYNANGSLDTTFGASGQAASVPTASAIVVQSDGRIVVAGSVISKLILPDDTGFGLVRYNSNGTLDATFGKRGLVVTDFGPTGPMAEPFALAVQPNGAIIAAGVAGPAQRAFGATPSSFALARYNSLGQRDTSFGAGGKVTTGFGSNTASICALALQSDGKIVAAGNSGTLVMQSFVNNIAVARYLAQ